jgi:Flp pilus assembly protein TadG
MKGLVSMLRRFCADRSGVSAIMLALSLTSILGFAGLAVDVGLWYFDKRTAQNAADSAAFTAANVYKDEIGSTPSSAQTYATSAAKAVAATYGYVDGSNGVTVTVNYPPSSAAGSYAGNTGAFEVIITKPESLFFSALYLSAVSVSSRAVALYTTTGGGSGGGGGCLVTLDHTSAGAINISNGVTVDAQCGALSNGTGAAAVSVQGGSKLYTSDVATPGGIVVGNGGEICSASSYGTSTCSPTTETTGAPTTTDPYSSTTLSSIESASNSGYNVPASCPTSSPVSFNSWGGTVTTNTGRYVANGGTYTINPGVYCGGISVSNGVSVNFSPGIYYIMGGQFTLNSGNNSATGGVTIVLVDDNGSAPTVTIGNGGNLAINSPSSGPTAGIAFYGDPSNTGAVTFNGGAQLTVNGSMYFPKSTLTFNNGTGIGLNSSCTELIGYDINVAGGMNLNLTNCSSYGVLPVGGTNTVGPVAIVQ